MNVIQNHYRILMFELSWPDSDGHNKKGDYNVFNI